MPGPMPPVPNVLNVAMQGTIPGEIWENRFYFTFSGPSPTQPTVATFAQNIFLQWSTHIGPIQETSVAQTQCVVTDISSDSGSQGIYANNVAGQRTGGTIAANGALLTSYPAPSRWRGGHFRTYWLAGVTTDLANPMSYTSTFVTVATAAIQAFFNTVIGTTVAGNQITAFVGVRRHGRHLPNQGAPLYVLNTPIVYQLPITSMVVHQQLASQKGRIGRRSK